MATSGQPLIPVAWLVHTYTNPGHPRLRPSTYPHRLYWATMTAPNSGSGEDGNAIFRTGVEPTELEVKGC